MKVIEGIAEKRKLIEGNEYLRVPQGVVSNEARSVEYFFALHNAWPAIERALRACDAYFNRETPEGPLSTARSLELSQRRVELAREVVASLAALAGRKEEPDA